jgi:hypothetical protein
MTAYGFRISFSVEDDLSELSRVIEDVADVLHANPDLLDVSIGADLEKGIVDFEVGVVAFGVHPAFQVVARAIRDAIEASGGEIVSFSLPATRPVEAPYGERLPGFTEPLETWHERATERVDA